MENNNNFICDKCNFICDSKARWEAHIKTELHVTGKRKKRSDYNEELHKCKNCNYETKNTTTMKTHILNKHSTLEDRKNKFSYFCVFCNFGSFYSDIYNVHVNTEKHKYQVLLNEQNKILLNNNNINKIDV